MSEQMRKEIVLSPGVEFVIRAADPLVEVLEEIRGFGHLHIGLSRHENGRWYCHSGLPEEGTGRMASTEFGQETGDSAIEAATARRDEVRKLAAERTKEPS